jgi:endonuclease/exonuclease/phosphatase family metal-dependent hydrolase
VAAARFLEGLVEDDRPHVVVAGDLDADADAASVRFWTGRQSLDGASVCYRDAWERGHPAEPGATFSPEENPLVADPDWPFRRIDHVLVRCGEHGGPTLGIERCERIFDAPVDGVWASDHFGVMADLSPVACA